MAHATRSRDMPAYQIQVNNKDFSVSEQVEAVGPDEARSEAVKGALQIGIEEICEGKSFFGAEIRIEGDGAPMERMLVAIGISPLR